VAFDDVPPISALPFFYAGRLIDAWESWARHTADSRRTVSEVHPHSTVCRRHIRSQRLQYRERDRAAPGQRQSHFGATYTFKAATSVIEPRITPTREIVLSRSTFDQATDEAKISRRSGGIHFRQVDLESREIGHNIGRLAWRRANALVRGREVAR
jgi:hypothetical protein